MDLDYLRAQYGDAKEALRALSARARSADTDIKLATIERVLNTFERYLENAAWAINRYEYQFQGYRKTYIMELELMDAFEALADFEAVADAQTEEDLATSSTVQAYAWLNDNRAVLDRRSR